MLVPCVPEFVENRRVILPGGLLRPEMCPGLGQIEANSNESPQMDWDPVALVLLMVGSLFMLGGKKQ